jgi:basic amino acid/polyamine antiporter, APA family
MTIKTATPRRLGFWMACALVVGNMIGSGVFLLPASLSPFGWNAVIAWMITISGALCLAAVFAKLAAAMPAAGGPYAYSRAAFGHAPAFLVAWSYWIALLVGNGAIATAAMSYLSLFFPILTQVQGLHAVVTLALIWGLTLINCRGAVLAGRVQLVSTLLKIIPLVLVIGVAVVVLMSKGGAAIMPIEPGEFNMGGITAAATLTLWALLGLESATVPADKVDQPERTIPRATLVGTAFTGALYLLVCSAIILMSPRGSLEGSNTPFADFIALHLGANAGAFISLFAIVSALGALNGWILLQGELPSAMARDGVFPAYMAKASSRGVPVRAHVISSALLSGVVLLNYSKTMAEFFNFLILLSTTSCLVMYLMTALAALTLQARGKLSGTAVFSVLGVLALIYSVWTIWGAGTEAMLWGFALLAVGVPVYFVTRRRGGAERDITGQG